MRLSSIFLLVTLLQVTAKSYSQDAMVSIHGNNMTLEQLFIEIEKQTDIKFLYRYENIAEKTVRVNVDNAPVSVVLNNVLSANALKVTLMDNNLLVVAPTDIKQQGIVVTGTVIDINGEPIPGVNVIVKGSMLGVVSDLNGRYNITIPNRDAVLQFSFVGYITQEVTVGSNNSIDVNLSEDTRQIEEVVVVGYGTQKKETLTGSITSVKGSELAVAPITNVTHSIAGRLPGVFAVTRSSEPGNDGTTIRVRGNNTLGNNDALIEIGRAHV